MTDRYLEFEDIQDSLGIGFGLGIDIDALYECFQIYSAGGGQDSDDGQTDCWASEDRMPAVSRSND
jgi:hypothetical protein